MEEFVSSSAGHSRDPAPAVSGRPLRAPFLPCPAPRLEREQAALDLADAAQAATRAANAFQRGELTDSRRLSRLARRLYDQADTHRRHADRARRADTEG